MSTIALQSLARSAGALTQHLRFSASAARVTKQPGMCFLRVAADKAAAPRAAAQTQTRSLSSFRVPSLIKAITPEQLNAMRLYARSGQCC